MDRRTVSRADARTDARTVVESPMKMSSSNLAAAMIAILSASFCVSCTETAPPDSNSGKASTGSLDAPVVTMSSPGATSSPPREPMAERAPVASAARPAQVARANPAPVTPEPRAPIPTDAQFTIECYTVGRLGHVEDTKRLKDELVKSTGWSGWYVVHKETESTLFYGYYRTFNDPKDFKETARAQNDRKRVIEWEDQKMAKPFKQALFVPLDAPDPTSPQEWNLVNAKGYWSVQIAAYRNSPDRKKAAVEAVRGARAMGIEAYYYHGDAISSVCIGAWPASAVKRQEGAMQYNTAADSERDLLILPPGMSEAMLNDIKRDNGDKLKVLQPKLDIVDSTLLETLKKYPTHSVNGEDELTVRTDASTGQKVSTPVHSMLVAIPERTANALGGDAGQAPPPPTDMLPRTRSTNGGLRGIGP